MGTEYSSTPWKKKNWNHWILLWAAWIQSTASHPFLRSICILTVHIHPNWGFPNRKPSTVCLLMPYTCPAYVMLLGSIALKLGERCKLANSSLHNISSPLILFPLGQSKHLVFRHSPNFVILLEWKIRLKTNTKQQIKVIVRYAFIFRI
jgi:hypothetical protein